MRWTSCLHLEIHHTIRVGSYVQRRSAPNRCFVFDPRWIRFEFGPPGMMMKEKERLISHLCL